MADEGATPRELVLEACRRNNTELLSEVITSTKPTSPSQSREDAVASLLNDTRDSWGRAALHIAAGAGSYEVIDLILDQPGVETDPLTTRDRDTPLHAAAQYANSFAPTSPDQAAAAAIVDILVDAGCDPRIRNKGKMKPVDVVDPRNQALRDMLRRAEVVLVEGESLLNVDAGEEEGGDGPPSDSD